MGWWGIMLMLLGSLSEIHIIANIGHAMIRRLSWMKLYSSDTDINNKLILIATFHLWNSSLDNLVKKIGKVLSLGRKGFITIIIWVVLLKNSCQQQNGLYFTETLKKKDKESGHVFKVWDTFERKTIKNYHDMYLRW